MFWFSLLNYLSWSNLSISFFVSSPLFVSLKFGLCWCLCRFVVRGKYCSFAEKYRWSSAEEQQLHKKNVQILWGGRGHQNFYYKCHKFYHNFLDLGIELEPNHYKLSILQQWVFSSWKHEWPFSRPFFPTTAGQCPILNLLWGPKLIYKI